MYKMCASVDKIFRSPFIQTQHSYQFKERLKNVGGRLWGRRVVESGRYEKK